MAKQTETKSLALVKVRPFWQAGGTC